MPSLRRFCDFYPAHSIHTADDTPGRRPGGISFSAVFLLILMCSACADFNPREAILAEGDWGWNEGAGCEGQADMVRITGDDLTMFKNGEIVGRGKFLARKATMRNDAGKYTGAVWEYLRKHPKGGDEIVRMEDWFSVRYSAGRVDALTLDRRYITEPDPDPAKRKKVRLPDDPRIGDRLKHCPEEESAS